MFLTSCVYTFIWLPVESLPIWALDEAPGSAIPELDIKRTVIYRAQTLNSHMRDLLFSNNNQPLQDFFKRMHDKTTLEAAFFFV